MKKRENGPLPSVGSPRTPPQRKERGLALVIVVLILASLVALAIPFVISMFFKERITRNTFFVNQARYDAQSARNIAITALYQTHDTYETKQDSVLPYTNPDADTPSELKVNMDAFSDLTKVPDPQGDIWGVDIFDEQGKINIRSATEAIMRNIKSIMSKSPGAKLEDFITDYSYYPDDWIEPNQLRGYFNYLLFDGREVTLLQTGSLSGRYTRDGARIRLSNGDKKFYACVMPSGICKTCDSVRYIPLLPHALHTPPPDGAGQALIDSVISSAVFMGVAVKSSLMLDRIIPDEFLSPQTIVEVARIHPININTAPDEVLKANLLGVGWHGYEMVWDEDAKQWVQVERDYRVTEEEAEKIIERIKGQIKIGGFTDITQYYLLLDECVSATDITGYQRNVLYNNNLGKSEFSDLINGYFTSTVPFCVRSYDTYTSVSTGIVNYPTGNEATTVTKREIMDITPKGINKWAIESQYDFDREFLTPYGNASMFSTYLNLTNLTATDPDALPDHSREPDKGELKLKASTDTRGNSIVLSDHFDNTHEGKDLQGIPVSYTANSIFTMQNLDIMPGGVEMWVKINTIASPIYFFDIGQRDYENRLALYYAGGDLILKACDATVAQEFSQIKANVTMKIDTWYHLGAYWKGTKYAQMALFLDGKSVGNFSHNIGGQDLVGELSGELTDSINITTPDGAGLIIPITFAGLFPSNGVVEIGDEAIEYNGLAGGGLRVVQVWIPNPTPGQPDLLAYHGRGARGSTIKKHPAGAKVTMYGYANVLKNTININGYPALDTSKIKTGGATVATELPQCMSVVEICKPEILDGDGDVIQEEGIQSTDSQIPITACDISYSVYNTQTYSYTSYNKTCTIDDFPEQGYIKIDNEVVFYSSKGTTDIKIIVEEDENGNGMIEPSEISTPTVSVGCFNGCQRGKAATTAASHGDQSETKLYSLKVTANTNYPDKTLLQVGDEWLGPVQKEGTDYFIGIVNGDIPLNFQRGYLWTGAITQTAGTKILPVIAAKSPYSGGGDRITIVEPDQTLDKEECIINRLRYINNQYLLTFTDNVNREYPVDNTITRLLKFPSDELLSYIPVSCYAGSKGPFIDGEIPVSFDGMIDEIKFFRTTKGDFKSAMDILTNIPASGDPITMNNVGGLGTPGLIKIGDEIIGYISIDTSNRQLINCKRGFLDSPIQTHDNSQRAMHMAFIPIGVLDADITSQEYHITFTTQSTFMPEGYILADNEVIGYSWLCGGDPCMPYDKNTSGIYRGSFGTIPTSHSQNTLVVGIPFRYYDRYQAGAFDVTMAYFQSATKMLDAKWKNLKWDDDNSNRPNVRIKMLSRFNGLPSWDTDPTNEENGIFEFTVPDDANELNLKSNQIEILTFVEYLTGAFLNDDWKHSPVLRGLWVEYEKPNQIITNQEK
jgi:type II secretory pathway pseudopilin PulG